jgi:acyl-CoA thioester hydrolase
MKKDNIMNPYFFETTVIWAQIDANQHMRHSAYADVAAHARVQMLDSIGLDSKAFFIHKLGPILFREEILYKREVHISEKIKVNCELTKSTPNGKKWSMRHEILKENGKLAAEIQVDGSWIDMKERKIVGLPEKLLAAFNQIPRSEDFEEIL